MANRLATAFSPADLAAIEAAVRDVESRVPGEVVPYSVEHSDRYAEAAWITAAMGALLGGVAAALAPAPFSWGWEIALWIAGLPALGAAVGYAAGALSPGLRVRLVHGDAVEHRVRQRAFAAFVEEEVFRTRARTGVLLFLSLLERRVIVLADAGIHGRVSPAEWDRVSAGIVDGMRRGQPGPALAAAIRACGELLVARGPAREAGDVDELPDQLRRRTE
jgi:putative membrane protein